MEPENNSPAKKKRLGSKAFYVSLGLLVLCFGSLGASAQTSDNDSLRSMENWVEDTTLLDDPSLIPNQSVFKSKEWQDYIALVSPKYINNYSLATEGRKYAETVILPWNKDDASEILKQLEAQDELYSQESALSMSGYPISEEELMDALIKIREEAATTGVSVDVLIEEWNPLNETKEDVETSYMPALIFSPDWHLAQPTIENKEVALVAFKKALNELNATGGVKTSWDALLENIVKED